MSRQSHLHSPPRHIPSTWFFRSFGEHSRRTMAQTFQKYASKFLFVNDFLVAPHAFEGQGNGILTTGPIQKTDSLISIPRDYLLSTNTVLTHSSLGRIVRASFKSASEAPLTAIEALSIGILFFKFNPSASDFWAHYLETLPTQYDSLIFWSSSDLKYLGSQEVLLSVERRNRKISALYEHTRLVFEKHYDASNALESNFLVHFTLESFRWAYASIMSRSVFVKDASLWNGDIALQKDNAALPPVLDFFNHSNETDCDAGYSSATQCYELKTKQDFSAQTQVFIKYGCHSNRTLLMHYGFAIQDNIYDAIPLKLDFHQMISQTSYSDEKIAKLSSYGLIDIPTANKSSKKVKHELTMDGLTWNTMVALKTMLIMTKEEILNWDRLIEDAPVSENNERLYRDYCRTLYSSRLSELDDAELMAGNDSITKNSVCGLLAKLFRDGWRSILQHAISALDS